MEYCEFSKWLVVNMGKREPGVCNAEGAPFVCTSDKDINAKTVEGDPFANITNENLNVEHVKVHPFVSTIGVNINAKTVEGHRFANITEEDPFAACDIFDKTPILFVRWNPDEWKVNGKTIRKSKKAKMETLLNYIEPYVTEEKILLEKLTVVTMYYPCEIDEQTGENPTNKIIKEYSAEELEKKLDLIIPKFVDEIFD